MKIACLGAGMWGFCLARLLSEKGYHVRSWARRSELVSQLNETREHPELPHRPIRRDVVFSTDLAATLDGADIIVEAVTSKGVRPVFETIHEMGLARAVPIVITSKGIEQQSGLILPEVVLSIVGESFRPLLGILSGPGFAHEVSVRLPTSIVAGAYTPALATRIAELFTTDFLRVYPNNDLRGVAFGGALKNIVAIACGIADGLELGVGAKAALMTRGLHEMVKLAKTQGCRQETLYGLSGMGDLFLTCTDQSRNFRFGVLLSQGESPQEARAHIHTVVEGAYTCVSALELAQPLGIALPITEAIVAITRGTLDTRTAVSHLMQRTIKEEPL